MIQKSVQSRCSIHSLQNKNQCSTSFSSKFGFFISDASKINRRSCKVAGEEGTCMFVWECLKTDGKHLGMCMDGFMFGSCCVHNDAQNTVIDNKVKDKPGKNYTFCVAVVNAKNQQLLLFIIFFVAILVTESSSVSLAPITALSTLATSTTPTPPTPPVRPTRPSRPSKPSHHPIKWPSHFHQKLKPIGDIIDEAEDKIDDQKNKNKKKPSSQHLINTKPPKDPRPNLPTRYYIFFFICRL